VFRVDLGAVHVVVVACVCVCVCSNWSLGTIVQQYGSRLTPETDGDSPLLVLASASSSVAAIHTPCTCNIADEDSVDGVGSAAACGSINQSHGCPCSDSFN
jgi:hypothetical protein